MTGLRRGTWSSLPRPATSGVSQTLPRSAHPTASSAGERESFVERTPFQIGVAAEQHRLRPRRRNLPGLQHRVRVIGPLGHCVVSSPCCPAHARELVTLPGFKQLEQFLLVLLPAGQLRFERQVTRVRLRAREDTPDVPPSASRIERRSRQRRVCLVCLVDLLTDQPQGPPGFLDADAGIAVVADIDIGGLAPLATQRRREGVMADHSNRRQLGGEPMLAVVAPSEEHVWLHFVTGNHLEVSGDVRQHPATLTRAESAGHLDMGAALGYQSVDRLRRLRVLDRLVLVGHDAQYDAAVLPNGEPIAFDWASVVSADRLQPDHPLQAGVADHVCRGLEPVDLYAETVPRRLPRVRDLGSTTHLADLVGHRQLLLSRPFLDTAFAAWGGSFSTRSTNCAFRSPIVSRVVEPTSRLAAPMDTDIASSADGPTRPKKRAASTAVTVRVSTRASACAPRRVARPVVSR